MIDIIIPYHSTKEYLDRCLSSLYSQTCQYFTITVINDYPDTKLDNIDNVQVINNDKNLGPGLSRQVGIDNTSSDYIMFVDSDDVLIPYAIKLFNEVIEKETPDFINSPHFIEDTVHKNTDMYINRLGATWLHGKVYSRKMIEKYNITFNSKYSFWLDDGYFNSIVFSCADKICNIALPTYIWCQNYDSLIHTTTLTQDEKDLILLRAMSDAQDLVESHNKSFKHIQGTINQILKRRNLSDMPNEEAKLINKLLKRGDKYIE